MRLNQKQIYLFLWKLKNCLLEEAIAQSQPAIKNKKDRKTRKQRSFMIIKD